MLNARQACWAEFIADYDFKITHTPGRSNGKADALTQQEGDVAQQKELKKSSRNRALLTPARLEPQIKAILISANSPATAAAPIPDIHLTTELVRANKSDPELDTWRQKASDPNSPWTLSDQGLLLHKGRLIISEKDNLQTKVINLIHSPINSAHPGKRKTKQLLAAQYFWPSMAAEAEWFISNCS